MGPALTSVRSQQVDCTTAGRSGGNTARISPSLKRASGASFDAAKGFGELKEVSSPGGHLSDLARSASRTSLSNFVQFD